MRKETILYGTFFLIITNFIVKLMSLFYRGIMIRLIGAEGLGLTEMMMPFFSLLLVIASLGIPLVISNSVSMEVKDNPKWSIVKTGICLLSIISLTVVITAFIIFPLIGDVIFGDPRVKPAFYIMIPSVFIISVCSAFRGYFQGNHQSSFIGKSQVAEQSIRLICGIIIVTLLIDKGASLTVIIMGVAAASLMAESGGGIYLWYRYKKQRGAAKGHFRAESAKNMISSGIPITLSRIMISFASAFQAMIVPQSLMAQGASATAAATFYGLFAGVALTILHLPSIVTSALITPLIPSIADAHSCGNFALRNERICKSILFTNITALPVLAMLFCFSEEICAIIFSSAEAGPMLAFLSLGGIFLYLQQPVIGILQGMNQFHRIFIHYLIADLLYIISLICLYHTKTFSQDIFILIYILNNLLLFAFNYGYLKKITKFRCPWGKTFMVPLFGIICGFTVLFCFVNKIMQTNTMEIPSMILSASIFFLIYLSVLYIGGTIDKKLISSFLSRHKHH